MRHSFTRAATLAALLSFPLSAAWAIDGDPAAGKTAFNKCAACHSVQAGQNKVGPSLHGIVGRKAASIEGFSYSPAMKAHDVVWNEAELDKYLADPRGVVQGTKMIFPGLKNETERKNVIARAPENGNETYVRTLCRRSGTVLGTRQPR